MNRRILFPNVPFLTAAAVLGLWLSLGWANATENAGGQAGVAGQSLRQSSAGWESLAQTPVSEPAAERVQRKNGRWVRSGSSALVAPGAIVPTAGQWSEAAFGDLGGDLLFAPAGIPPSPAAGVSFAGPLDNGTRFNPDTQGAVGPNHLMATLSSEIRIQDRSGATLSSMTLNQFWSSLSVTSVFDPRILYDRTAQRWIHTAIANPGENNAGLLIAVSQTSSPLGNWNRHFIAMASTNRIFPDSPNVGFNKDWITVQANMFDNTNFNFFSSDIWAFNKATLYAGGTATYRQFRFRQESLGPLNALVPAVTYDTGLATNFLVANWVGNFPDPDLGPIGLLRVFSIGGPVDSPVFNDYDSGMYVFGSASLFNPPWADFDPFNDNFAPQLGSTNKIFIGDARIQNVVFRNSTIWCAHHIFLPYDNPTRSAVQWFACTPGGTVLQRGRVEDPANVKFFAYPSIAVNQFEDVLIGYSRFGANQYPSANYSFHGYEDFPGTLQGDTVLKAGDGPFAVSDSGTVHWGDWSATVVDPNEIDLWTLQEYGAAPSGGADRWGTWWGVVSPPTSLAIAMTASTNSVLATANITYTVRATNTQPSVATGVRLVDTLPAGASFVSATISQGSCTPSAGLVTCDVGSLAASGIVTATFVIKLNESGTATNRATVSAYGPETTPSDNSAVIQTSVTPTADLSVSVTDSPDPVPLNATLTYQVTVANAGPSVAPGVLLTNTLPPGVTFVSATAGQGSCTRNGNIVSCSLGALAPGGNVPVTIRVTPTASAQLTFTATVSAPTVADLTVANNSAVAVTRANSVPTLTGLNNRSTPEDISTGQMAITVGDAETAAASLNLGGFSSTPGVVPDANITFSGAGSARFVSVQPAPNASGTATIFYYVTDGDGSSTTNSFVLTVTPVNDAPTISAVLTQTIPEDTTMGPINFTVADVETPAASLQVTATSSNPTLVPSGNITIIGTTGTRSISIQPTTNQFGNATITLQVSDGTTNTTFPFLLQVNSVNDLPTIGPIGDRTVDEDTDTGAIVFTVGDVETPLANLTFSASSSNPSLVSTSNITFGGSLGNRTVTVKPTADQSGVATITVIVSDGSGTTNRSFLLTVRDVNDPPTLGAISNISVNEDSGTNSITLTVISAGAGNENQSLTVTATSGNPSIVPDPQIVYTSPAQSGTLRFAPSLNATGSVAITVTVTDSGTTNNTTNRVFTITVLPANDAPTITGLSNQTTAEDTSTGPIPFTVDDIDTPSQNLTFTVASTNTALIPVGNVSIAGTGTSRTVEVRPATNQFGRSLISIIVNDGQATATNSFVIDVTPVNDPPELAALSPIVTPEDVATNGVVTITDDSTSAAALQVFASSANTGLIPHANVTFTGTGTTRTMNLAPLPNASGGALITVFVRDAEGLVASNSFTFTVQPVNDPPTLAQPGDVAIAEDAGLQVVNLTGIGTGAANELQSLVVTATSDNPALIPNPSVSYLSPNPNGSLSFTPVANAAGSAVITVMVDDGQASNNRFSRTFTVQVAPSNDPPTLTIPTEVTMLEDGTTNLTITLSDPDSTATVLVIQTGSSNEELIDASGVSVTTNSLTRTLTLAPLPNQSGSAVITVQVSDGSGGSDVEFINLTVTAVNDAPFVSSIPDVTIDHDTSTAQIPFTISDEETFANDLHVSARSANSTLVPPAGIVLGGSDFDRTIRLTPAPGVAGITLITIDVSDDDGATNSTSFVLRVRGDNSAPFISPIADQTTEKNRPTTPGDFTVEDDKTAPANLQLQATSSNPGLVANAAIQILGTGTSRTISVQPTTNQIGTTFITVSARDQEGLTSQQTFRVVVLPVDYPPTVTGLGAVSLPEDGQTTINFVVGDAESGAGALTVMVSSATPAVIPMSGLTLGGTGASRSLIIRPAANQAGASLLTVTVTDTNGNATNVTFQATVTAVNDSPTVAGLTTVSIEEDTSSGPITIVVGDADPDAGSLNVTAQSLNQTILPNSGLAVTGSGNVRTLVVTPAANQFGTVSVVVTVADGAGGTVTSNLVVVINAVNDAPTLNQPANLTMNEDAGAQTVPLSGISAGPGENQSLVVTATSSNPGLIPNPSVTYSSPAATGSLQFTPVNNANGVATITVNVSDGQALNGTFSRTFTVTVGATNDAPFIVGLGPQSTLEDTPFITPLILADPELGGESLTLTATSTNTTLVANANILFTGTGTNRTLTVIPSPNLSGQTLITIQASDGTLTGTSSFLLTVTAVNDAPTLNLIPNFQTNAASGNPNYTIPLTGISSGATNENQTITVTASSSNTGFLPSPIVTYTSPNSSGSLALRPANNGTGSAVVTVTVSDNGGGSNTFTRTFLVTAKTVANVLPTISGLANQTINEDEVAGPIPFTIRDAETTASALTLSAVSSDPNLVPNANIQFGTTSSSSNRTVTVTPRSNQSGTASITVTVVDGGFGTSNQTFTVTVNPINDPPTISGPGNQAGAEDSVFGPYPVTVGDPETRAGDLTLAASSSDTTLFPNGSIVFSGSVAARTVTLSPATNVTGTATIRLVVSDGALTATNTFVVTVNPANDAPTISDIPNQTTTEDTILADVPFTIGDLESGPNTLALSATSSNPTLIPSANVTFGGTGSARTLNMLPATNQFGTATITVTVGDGSSTASDVFVVTVNPVNDPPTLDALNNLTTGPGSGSLTVPLSGISFGPANESQSILVTAASSDPSIVGHPVVTYSGAAATGSLSLSALPGATGSAVITVTVNDGQAANNTAVRTFTVSTTQGPTLSPIANQVLAEDQASAPISFTVGDAETSAAALIVTATSSNSALLRTNGLALTGNAGTRQLVLTPEPNESGQATVTVTVEDAATNRTSTTFLVTVRAVNDRPTLNPLGNLSIDAAAGARIVNLAGISSGASNENQVLTVTAKSSHPAIIPDPAVSYTSPGATGSITLNPAGPGGTVTISVTVQDDSFDDGSGSNRITQTFVVDVSGPSGTPALAIELVNGRVLVSWPTNGAGSFVLQGSAKVDATAPWSEVPGTPAVVNGRYVVTNTPSASTRFFRLCDGCGGPPSLTIVRSGAEVVVSWPTAGSAGYVLQGAPAVTGNSWANVPTAPTVVGGFNTIRAATSGAPRFYRLCRGCGN